jgi:hypothetical protein
MPTDNELRQAYPDVLSGVDTDRLCLVRDLHAIGHASRDLASADAGRGFENGVPNHSPRDHRPVPSSRVRLSRLHGLATLPAVLVLLALIASGAALAINNISNLGKPSNAVPLYLPIGSFRHAGPVLRQHGKPELLLIDTSIDGGSAAERWPVVKALSQFGTWSGLRAGTIPGCQLVNLGKQINCKVPYGYMDVRGVATFDFSHAHYASRYATFVSKDLIDRALHFHLGLSSQQMALFNRYARPPGYPNFRDAVLQASLGGSGSIAGRGLPLLVVGGYVESSANVVTPGDLESTRTTLGLPFSTIQRSLQRGRPVGGAPTNLVYDVNGEANIITALICHSDRMQPKKVCGRAVIRKIVRHVK